MTALEWFFVWVLVVSWETPCQCLKPRKASPCLPPN